ALDAGCVVDARQQVAEALSASVTEVELIAVDRLTQEHDFLATLRGELTHFSGDVLGRPALLGTAHAEHDAVAAEPLAAGHAAHLSREARRPHRRIPQRIIALEAVRDLRPRRLGPPQADRHLEASRLLHFADQRRQLGQLTGATDDVHVRGALLDQLLVFL